MQRLLLTRAMAVIAAAGALSGAPIAQQKPGPVPGERPAGVVVDFIALTADGQPVPDLRVEEVSVRLNGRERAVQSLRVMRAGVEPVAPAAADAVPPPYGENTIASSPGRRRIALVIDSDSFDAGSEPPLRDAVGGLLGGLAPGDMVMLAYLPYGGVKVPFTHEHARIRTALTTFAGQRKRTETGSEMACRTRRVLESLTGLLETLPAGDAPTGFVFFTAGMAGPRRDGLGGLPPGMCQLEVMTFQKAAAAAMAARASFYVVHPDSLPRVGSGSSTGALGSDNPVEGIEHLAGVTGGERVPLLATGRDALQRVARDTGTYYVAEIAAERGDVDGATQRLNVRVSRPGVSVRARPAIGFSRPAPLAPLAGRMPTVSQLLLTAEAFADLPLRVTGVPIRAPEGQVAVVAIGEPGPGAIELSSAAMALIDPEGRVVAQASVADPRVAPMVAAMMVPPGPYRLRLAAADASGRFGTADIEVDASLTPAGPLQLSGLTLGLSRGGAIRPRLEFGAEPLALGSFEIYGVPSAPMSAVLEISRTPAGPALVTSRVAIDRAEADRLIATGSLPIGALPPGDYIVRARVSVDGGAPAQVMRTLRKRGV